MKTKSIVITTLLSVVVFIFLGLIAFLHIFYKDYIDEVILEKDTVINTDWHEINTENLVKVYKDNHYVSIILDSSFHSDPENKAIKIPSGKNINPEIKLIDSKGKEYSLLYSGSRYYKNSEYVNYQFQGDLPIGKNFEKLKLRSDEPIKTQEIIWSGYNSKDLK
ncbi:hypothetical protein BH20ACI4_BH20ACI4_34620 [soil metagenome]